MREKEIDAKNEERTQKNTIVTQECEIKQSGWVQFYNTTKHFSVGPKPIK